MKSVIIIPKKYEDKAKDEVFWNLVKHKINIREPFSFIPKIRPLQPEEIQMVIDREHIQRADGQFILNGNFASMEKVYDYIKENYEKIEIEIIQGQATKVEIVIRGEE